jgi:hypothetical protein
MNQNSKHISIIASSSSKGFGWSYCSFYFGGKMNPGGDAEI